MRVCAVNGTNCGVMAGRSSCSRRPYCLASTTIERPSGVSSASEASCAASASSPSLDARHRDERGGLAVAERDRAGLVEQQHVDVARRLDRAARQREHVAAHEPVHAGDADRRQQRADRRRDQRDEQRDQRGVDDVGAGEVGERPQRHDDDEEDRASARRAGCRARSRSASCAATAPSTSAIIRSRNDSPGLLGDLDDDPVGEHARAAGDGRAVAAGLADHGRGLAGDRRLVDRGDALDHGAVARDHLARLDDDDVAAASARRRACVDRRAASRRSPSASRAASPPGPCRGPRRSPRRGCRRGPSATARPRRSSVNQPGSSPPSTGAEPAAPVDVRSARRPRRRTSPGCAPCARGSSLRSDWRRSAGSDRRVEQRRQRSVIGADSSLSSARLSSSTFTPGSPRNPSEAAVGVARRSARRPARAGGRARAATRRAWMRGVRRRDVRVDARRRGGDGVDGTSAAQAVGVGALELRGSASAFAASRSAQLACAGSGRVVEERSRRARSRSPTGGSGSSFALRACEVLADQARADDLAVALDRRAVGVARERDLAIAGDRRAGRRGRAATVKRTTATAEAMSPCAWRIRRAGRSGPGRSGRAGGRARR